MIIYILLIIIVIISLLFFGLALYDDIRDIRGSDYEREIDKAIKDMKKRITTTIAEDQCGNFTVKKTKDGKKL